MYKIKKKYMHLKVRGYFFFFFGTGDFGSDCPASTLSTLSIFFLTGAGEGAGFKFFLSNFFCSLSFSSSS